MKASIQGGGYMAVSMREPFKQATQERVLDAPAKARALYAAYVGTLFTWSALGAEDSSELMNTLEASFAAICACEE